MNQIVYTLRCLACRGVTTLIGYTHGNSIQLLMHQSEELIRITIIKPMRAKYSHTEFNDHNIDIRVIYFYYLYDR